MRKYGNIWTPSQQWNNQDERLLYLCINWHPTWLQKWHFCDVVGETWCLWNMTPNGAVPSHGVSCFSIKRIPTFSHCTVLAPTSGLMNINEGSFSCVFIQPLPVHLCKVCSPTVGHNYRAKLNFNFYNIQEHFLANVQELIWQSNAVWLVTISWQSQNSHDVTSSHQQ